MENNNETSTIDQQAFTKVINHLRAQGKPAQIPGSDTCMYRGEDNTKCAVGCLINDEHYNPDLEYTSLWGFEVPKALKDSGWGDVSKDMLRDLQVVHDKHPQYEWEKKWAIIAGKYSLELPVG